MLMNSPVYEFMICYNWAGEAQPVLQEKYGPCWYNGRKDIWGDGVCWCVGVAPASIDPSHESVLHNERKQGDGGACIAI